MIRLLLLLLPLTLLAQIPGTFRVTGPVAPTATNSNYGAAVPVYNYGGLLTGLGSLSELQNLNIYPLARRHAGQLAVLTNGVAYQLGSDLTTWTLYSGNTNSQTVNNFTVKTNLGVEGTLTLSGANVNNAINGLVNPVSPSLADDWLATATWGDSLTAGSGGTPYPTVFQSISGTKTSNGGVGGETSTQIKVRMLAATNTHTQPTIIWAGRNNYDQTSTVLSDVASMVSALAAAGNTDKYLVLSVLNGDYGSFEAKGGGGYQLITNLNAQLKSTYGNKYAEVREHLVSLYNPSNPTDVANYANDIPPSSLRSDAIHLNSSGYSAVANFLFTNKFAQLRSSFGSSVTPALLTEYLKAPFTIGGLTPGVGYFSSLYATNVINYSTITTPMVLLGTASANKAIYLAGDNVSIQFASRAIPDTDNAYDFGYSDSALRWRNGYFANSLNAPTVRATTTYSTNVLSSSVTSATVYIGNSSANKALYLSGDNSSIQSGGRFIPDTDAAYDLGYSDSQLRWRNGYFTSTVSVPTVVVGGSGGPTIKSGSGSPESVVTAPVGSLYLRTNGGAGTTLYVKESGTGNTGWVAK